MEKDSSKNESRFKCRMAGRVPHIIGMVFVGIIFAVLFALAFGLFVKLLWNWLMPAIFGIGAITYWQAFGLVILARIFFGVFGFSKRDFRSKAHHPNFFGPFNGFQREGAHFDWSSRKWRSYYRDFWRDEGKAAFNAYVKRIEEEKSKGGK